MNLCEDIAKIIDPVAFTMKASDYWGLHNNDFKMSMAYGQQMVALKKAQEILDLLGLDDDSLVIPSEMFDKGSQILKGNSNE